MKILTIIGARPQFIKAAVVSRALLQSGCIKEVIVHTGQHFDQNMSGIFFDEMSIPQPNYNLNINNLPHGAMTGRMLEKIESILAAELPDYVLVYGDTNSTLAGALAAVKMHIKVIHVEAGLRSFNKKMPEEINRILTDRVSDILLCPTTTAIQNLLEEGYDTEEENIVNIGDVMYDTSIYYAKFAKKPNFDIPIEFALATIHRAENTDNERKLKNIVESLNEINRTVPIILPLHPRTLKCIERYGLVLDFITFPPVSYLEMIYLLQRANLVITDSGGLQKEAYFFKLPCITVRDQTEWVELIEIGANQLVDVNSKKALIFAVQEALNKSDKIEYGGNIYGAGNSADLLVQSLLKLESKKSKV